MLQTWAPKESRLVPAGHCLVNVEGVFPLEQTESKRFATFDVFGLRSSVSLAKKRQFCRVHVNVENFVSESLRSQAGSVEAENRRLQVARLPLTARSHPGLLGRLPKVEGLDMLLTGAAARSPSPFRTYDGLSLGLMPTS